MCPERRTSRRGRKALLPDAPCGPRKWAGRAVLGFAGRPRGDGCQGAGSPAPYLGTSYRCLPVDLVAAKATASSRPHALTATVADSAPPVSGSLAAPGGRGRASFPEACRLAEVRVLSRIRILGSADVFSARFGLGGYVGRVARSRDAVAELVRGRGLLDARPRSQLALQILAIFHGKSEHVGRAHAGIRDLCVVLVGRVSPLLSDVLAMTGGAIGTPPIKIAPASNISFFQYCPVNVS